MVQAFSLTEPKMLRAMERQKAYNGMRLLALYLEIVCIVITGVMGIFAQQMFNTRGGLDFYVFQMTAELILLTIVITNVTSPGTVSRFLNVIFFIIGVTCDFSHILLHIQRRGAYFKCTESDKLVQHCLWNIIPTHHHLLYTSGLLLLFHLAIVMVNVSAAVFYGGSLDHYQDKTPGKPEWVTNLPLHLHDKIDAARRLKPKARAFRLEDLPPGTTITREQEEQSVQYTTIGRDGSKKERPHDVTVTRRFTIKAPGIGSATGTRSWKAQKSSSLTDLTPGRQPKSNPRDNAIGVPNQWQPQHNQNGGAMFECPCGGPGEDLRASSGADQKGCPFEFPCGGTAEGPRTGAGKDPKTKTGRRSILSKVSSKVTQLPFLRGTNASKKK
ncbi:hypothetical protein Q1695_003907 [Nippostrongylus brasiliensis]|nr:hypothetical protein Q1695_003907 [Nippostrongylus brasiliensis]